MTTYVINDEQINNIINTLDAVAKNEGLSLKGQQTLIEFVIKPLTSLQEITINEPAEPSNSGESIEVKDNV